MDIVTIRNRVLRSDIEVYSCHPETFKKIKAEKADLPENWIVFQNPFTGEGNLEQLDLSIPQFQEMFFKGILPNPANYIQGEKKVG